MSDTMLYFSTSTPVTTLFRQDSVTTLSEWPVLHKGRTTEPTNMSFLSAELFSFANVAQLNNVQKINVTDVLRIMIHLLVVLLV